MTMLATHENGSGNTQAADGRFFNTPPTPGDMYKLSGDLLNSYGQILNDNRGILLQFAESKADNAGAQGDAVLPTPPRVHTLEFDGGNASWGRFAWRYTIAEPDKGRTVHDMHVWNGFWRVQESVYDQQGILRGQTDWADPVVLAGTIQQLVSGETFNTRAQDLLAKRQEAEAHLASLVVSLTARNLSEEKQAALLKKPSIGVEARSFVSCAPIPAIQ